MSDRNTFEKAIFRLNSYSFFLAVITLAGVELKQISILGNTANVTDPIILSVSLWLIWALALYSYIVEFLSEEPKYERRAIIKSSEQILTEHRKKFFIPLLKIQGKQIFEKQLEEDRGSGEPITISNFRIDSENSIAIGIAQYRGQENNKAQVSARYPLTTRLCDEGRFALIRIFTTRMLRDHILPWIFASTPVICLIARQLTS